MRTSAVVSCLGLVVISACSDRSGANASGETGGTIVMTIAGNEPSPLFPALSVDQLSRLICDQIYDRLAEIGPQLNVTGDAGFQPRLARSWTWAPDSLSVAFSIDPRARWHDGHPVGASDVAFTFAVSKDRKTGGVIESTITNIDSVTVRDSLTAVFWFHRRNAEQFFDAVYQLPVIPEHLLKDVPRDKIGTSDFVKHPIGTGRFRFARWEPGVRIELLADTANYRGRAKLDRVIFSMTPDASASLTQILSGQADLMDQIPVAVIPRVDSAPQLHAIRYAGAAFGFMLMQTRDPKRPAQPHPVFGDRQVRRALSMAVDRQAMNRNVYDTLGVVGSGPFARAFADTTITLPPFDRARAAALLDSAGWRLGPNGVRVKNGRPLAFNLMVPTSSSARMRYAVLLNEQFKAVGARADIEQVDFSNFQTRLLAKNFDALINAQTPDPSRAAISQGWGSAGIAGGQNYSNFSSPTFDALLDSASQSFDTAKAHGYYHRVYQTLVDDAPAIWLYDVLNFMALHKRIRPAPMRPDYWWANLADWSIPAGERIDRDKIGLRAPPPQP